MGAGRIPGKAGEEWRLVEGTDDYFISNFGRFRHGVKLRKLSYDKDGYLTCNVGKKRCRVHRLVAQAFIPNPDNLPVVDHISGDKLDNNVSNLRWVTQQENSQAAHDLGLSRSGHKSYNILAVDKNHDATLYKNQAEVGKVLGVDSRTVSRVANGKEKTAKGYQFIKINTLTDAR